jgi:hypothetical protein
MMRGLPTRCPSALTGRYDALREVRLSPSTQSASPFIPISLQIRFGVPESSEEHSSSGMGKGAKAQRDLFTRPHLKCAPEPFVFRCIGSDANGHGGLQGCGSLRIPHCLDSQPYAPAALCSRETLFSCFWYSFLLVAESTSGPSADGRSR